ncbi:MAG: nucleotide exchange factor GrpE [Rickettsiales bacterium]|nr:nucleotide exchange factor GrpE [Rickettsiales bacterium]
MANMEEMAKAADCAAPESEPAPVSDSTAEPDAACGKDAAELAGLKDKYLRLAADMDNLRKRSALDSENAARSRAASVAEQFLPLIDAIDAALAISPGDEGIGTLKKAADGALANVGMTRIDSIGLPLNPAFHNAITIEESEQAENTIVRELQSGFMFGESVLRAAMVVAAKKPAAPDAKPE